MKKRATLIAILAVLIASFIWLRNHSALFNLFFPPEGLYESLGSTPLSDYPKAYEFEVEHKYPGRYELAVISPSAPEIDVPYKMEFQAMVVISNNQSHVLERNVSTPYSQFWRRNDGGIVLVSYRVPEQVAKNNPTRIRVVISGNVESFNKNYGASSLAIKKGPDK